MPHQPPPSHRPVPGDESTCRTYWSCFSGRRGLTHSDHSVEASSVKTSSDLHVAESYGLYLISLTSHRILFNKIFPFWKNPAFLISLVSSFPGLSQDLCFVFFVFFLFRAASTAYGRSQARGQVGAIAASLRHSHSNAGSEPPLRPTPQLTAMPDP